MEKSTHQRAWFLEVCTKNQLQVTEEQLDQLAEFIALLLEWNKKVNLISRKDEQNIWKNHILHCASILFRLSLPRDSRVIDIGTGGGLPGVPLKILQPDLQVTLLDSIGKKVSAVQDIVRRLSIPGVLAQQGRAEEFRSGSMPGGQYDIAIARAVAPLETLVSWSRPILRNNQGPQTNAQDPGGRIRIEPPALLAMKGGDLTEEIDKIRGLTGIQSISTIALPQNSATGKENGDKNVVYVSFH